MSPAPLSVRFRIDLAAGCAIGPGKVALLEAIAREGSLSAAARNLGMSYRRAWLLLMSMNRSFREPVAATSVGGPGGGGVMVTQFGHALIRTFRAFETEVSGLAHRRWRTLARAAGAPAARPRKGPGTKRLAPRGAGARRPASRARRKP